MTLLSRSLSGTHWTVVGVYRIGARRGWLFRPHTAQVLGCSIGDEGSLPEPDAATPRDARLIRHRGGTVLALRPGRVDRRLDLPVVLVHWLRHHSATAVLAGALATPASRRPDDRVDHLSCALCWPGGVLPIVALAAMTYLIGLSRRPQLCVLGMVVCGLALVFYKYTIFMSGQVVGAFFPEVGSALLATVQTALPSTPPLAISFFVFEFAHYLFEVHRGGYPIRNPVHFGLFSIFWPSLVAGPIKRYTEFIPALTRGTMTCSTIDVAAGFPRVAIGATKKVIADNLTLWIEVQTHFYEQVDVQWRWFFFVVLALRIYLDFSGYSDLAIGYARMLGIVSPRTSTIRTSQPA